MAEDDQKSDQSLYWNAVRRRMWDRENRRRGDKIERAFGVIPGKTPAESYEINQRAFAKAILAMADRVPAGDVAKAHATLARYPR